jgi:DNA-directed RNA polymerase specialized sigma24 family protein
MSVHHFKNTFHKLHTLLRNLAFRYYPKNEETKERPSDLINDVESKIMTQDLAGMVQQLDISLRIPYEMYYVGHPYQDIAHTLKLPLDAVKSSIYYAQKELKEKIERCYMVA